jgi:hypothetical protein
MTPNADTGARYKSVHHDRITGGPATRRVRYPRSKNANWDYMSTTNCAPNAEIEYWNPQTGRWE